MTTDFNLSLQLIIQASLHKKIINSKDIYQMSDDETSTMVITNLLSVENYHIQSLLRYKVR